MAEGAKEAATPALVAQFLADLLAGDRYLTQEAAAHHIRERFGDGFLATGENGNLAVSPTVLQVFRARFSPPSERRVG